MNYGEVITNILVFDSMVAWTLNVILSPPINIKNYNFKTKKSLTTYMEANYKHQQNWQ
jgi:hypothetical protein